MPVPPAGLPEPPLSDGFVKLRAWSEDDVPAIVAALEDPEISRWIDRIPFPYTESDARSFVAGDGGFAIVDGSTGAVLGASGVSWADAGQGGATVGYWVCREARGRGVATRATRLVAEWVLGELGFERLELRADTQNEASCRVAERLGFSLDGTLRSVRYNARQKRRIDLRVYSLLRSELPGAAA
jgi:RimJ/RimL family protein N-acetyltransferase